MEVTFSRRVFLASVGASLGLVAGYSADVRRRVEGGTVSTDKPWTTERDRTKYRIELDEIQDGTSARFSVAVDDEPVYDEPVLWEERSAYDLVDEADIRVNKIYSDREEAQFALVYED